MSKLVTRVVEGVEFAYQPSSGRVFRKFKSGWKETGLTGSKGYLQVSIGHVSFWVHRLIWYIVHGNWPKYEIDHIDGNRQNNKLVNLRDVDAYANGHNRTCLNIDNTSGHNGVSYIRTRKYWVAQIRIKGKLIRKCCKTKEEAIEARKQLEIDYGIA